jgi:hypothetical protein
MYTRSPTPPHPHPQPYPYPHPPTQTDSGTAAPAHGPYPLEVRGRTGPVTSRARANLHRERTSQIFSPVTKSVTEDPMRPSPLRPQSPIRRHKPLGGKILKSQCPSIFNIQRHYIENFSELLHTPHRMKSSASHSNNAFRIPPPPWAANGR